MEQFEIVVPVMFGIEAVCAREIKNLGYETTKVEDGRITFLGDAEAVARANICLRRPSGFCKVVNFGGHFDELFERPKNFLGKTGSPSIMLFRLKDFPEIQSFFLFLTVRALSKRASLSGSNKNTE